MQILRVIARLLDYPTEELQEAKDALVAAILDDSHVPTEKKQALLRCVEVFCSDDLMDLQENAYLAISAHPAGASRPLRLHRQC